MIVAYVSRQFVEGYGDRLKAVAKEACKPVEFITVPETPGARLSPADCNRIDCTFIDRDIRNVQKLS